MVWKEITETDLPDLEELMQNIPGMTTEAERGKEAGAKIIGIGL